MTSFEVTREISATPRRVFDFLADGRRHAEWIDKDHQQGPLREAVVTEHLSGPEVGEGGTYCGGQAMGRWKGQGYTFRTEVYEPTHRLVFRGDGSYDIVFDLIETQAGTRVTLRRDYGERPRRLLGRLLWGWAVKPKYVEPTIADDLLRIERALGTSASPKSSAKAVL